MLWQAVLTRALAALRQPGLGLPDDRLTLLPPCPPIAVLIYRGEDNGKTLELLGPLALSVGPGEPAPSLTDRYGQQRVPQPLVARGLFLARRLELDCAPAAAPHATAGAASAKHARAPDLLDSARTRHRHSEPGSPNVNGRTRQQPAVCFGSAHAHYI